MTPPQTRLGALCARYERITRLLNPPNGTWNLTEQQAEILRSRRQTAANRIWQEKQRALR